MLSRRLESVREPHSHKAFQAGCVLPTRFENFYLLNSSNFGFKSKSSQIMVNSRLNLLPMCCAGVRLRPPQASRSESGGQYVATI